MKIGKRSLALLLCLVLCISLLPATALAVEGTITPTDKNGMIEITAAGETAETMLASGDGMTELHDADGTDWSQYSLHDADNGKTVNGSKTFLIPEEGVTLLMFFSTTCGNCMADTEAISETSWLRNDRVRVMAMETNGADREKTEAFLETYAGSAKSCFHAYYGSGCTNLMWNYVYRIFDTGSVTWPLLVLLIEEDGVPTIRYASTGYQYISEITEHVEALLEKVKKPEPPELQNLSASSKGVTLSWNDVSDAAKYKVYRKSTGGSWEALKATKETSYTDAAVQMGAKYAYKVRATNGVAWSDDSNEDSIVFNPFIDVESGGTPFKYVSWAYNNGVVTGTSDTTFSPKANCTKVQFVMMLWKMHGSPMVGGENPFSDISGTKTTNAIMWALNKGIINSGSKFNPKTPISRSQIVMMLWKLAGSPKATGENPFSDITDGSKLCKAVMWAYNNKITKGTSDTTFSPDNDCTRLQLVTFLYKYNNIYHVI
ncbi:MAG: S-layer homology domain-containing protein [Oscillospiraceae bacterium]|nr:S-layer homology domain-containing protein [Oscillospiraceae bacterium]